LQKNLGLPNGLLGLGALAALVLLPISAANAQRLPQNVKPQHYTLTLTPDLKAATFTGKETIDVMLAQPANDIVLNAAQITFDKVTITSGGKTQTAQVAQDKAKEQATFTVPAQIPAGKATIHINYTGILNGELRGFYLSKTAKRNYAVTQFEPTDARRAFPSFDEPAMKATFSTTLIVDKGDTAISNTNIISDKPGPGADKHTVKFATTPKMSTYLVAFLVGDFQCQSGSSDGVPIRACATPDKVQMTGYALHAAEFFLHYYDTYFGIKYPMPKLDMIAIPDFEAGAMENFGAITYRETALLVDPKTASIDAKKGVATDVAHEMAHQWFGDMVTMQWWNNLWLNEGFATWMESKAVNAWKPNWNISQDDALAMDGVLNYDAGKVTRAIRAKADTPGEINEMFDGITYQKGGAVLGMTENYETPEVFRRGVHKYLSEHMYGNATAEDFWNAQTATSGKPIDKVMDSFIGQAGVPLLQFTAPSSGKTTVAQQRFYITPGMTSPTAQTWTVPVCFKTAAGSNETPKCELLTAAKQSVAVPSGDIFYANANDKGYYRTQYAPADYSNILNGIETKLTAPERIGFAGNMWALMRSGRGSIGDYMNLAAALRNDNSYGVIHELGGAMVSVDDRIATPEERQMLAAWIRKEFGPAYERVKTPRPDDTADTRQLRSALFGMLGELGKDPQVIAQAREITNKYLENPTSVEPGMVRPAIFISTANGDSALFDKLQKVSETTNNPDERTTALYALATFKDPALLHRALDYATSGKVRNQDSIILMIIGLRDRDTRAMTWQYIQQNWPKVKAQITTMMGGYLVGSTGAFCSADKAQEVQSFFTAHPVPAAQTAIKRATDEIHDCMQFRSAQQPRLASWMEQQHLSAQ
jgi:aminopeptidase N